MRQLLSYSGSDGSNGPSAGERCHIMVMTSLNGLLGDGCCHVVDQTCLRGLSAEEC